MPRSRQTLVQWNVTAAKWFESSPIVIWKRCRNKALSPATCSVRAVQQLQGKGEGERGGGVVCYAMSVPYLGN